MEKECKQQVMQPDKGVNVSVGYSPSQERKRRILTRECSKGGNLEEGKSLQAEHDKEIARCGLVAAQIENKIVPIGGPMGCGGQGKEAGRDMTREVLCEKINTLNEGDMLEQHLGENEVGVDGLEQI
ncbi:hypothetical protein SUGI_1010240 [Cryptomeria japonica]|nr:hypothetical protein SUGI_1010240 [Cryptomeria japonica]